MTPGATSGNPLHGRPTAAELIAAVAEFLETDAAYDYDITTALDQLDASGWVTGDDGIRAKGKTVAQFTLHYPAGDTVSAGLAEAFATNARSIGVQVDLEPVSAGALTGAVVTGFGDPFDPDLALYDLLRSGRTALGGSVNETVDSALDMVNDVMPLMT